MRKSHLLLALLLLTVTLAAQSDILYYRFITPTGTSVMNFAPGGPTNGTLKSTYPTTGQYMRAPGCSAPWALYGSHLDPSTQAVNTAYHNHVDTGWVPKVSGSFTMAWFQKERCPNTTNGLAYLTTGVGSFRCFHGGVAYNGLYLRAWGGTPADLILRDPAKSTTTEPKFDLLAASRDRWVHVAIVVDAKAMRATWYIDGQALKPSITLTAGANVAGTTNMKVGQHSSTGSSYRHDVDEFRFSTRAATPAEIRLWARVRPGESWSYGAGCNQGTLAAPAGPALGKPFLMDVGGAPSAGGIVSVGTSRTRLGTLPLPFDLGNFLPGMKGCMFESSMTFILAATLDASGRGKVAIPIPNDPLYTNFKFYCQGLLVAPPSTVVLTNGLAGIIGN